MIARIASFCRDRCEYFRKKRIEASRLALLENLYMVEYYKAQAQMHRRIIKAMENESRV